MLCAESGVISMKTKSVSRIAGALLAASLVFPVAACSEDEVPQAQAKEAESATQEETVTMHGDYLGFPTAAEAIEFSDLVLIVKLREEKIVNFSAEVTMNTVDVVQILKGKDVPESVKLTQDGGVKGLASFREASTTYMSEYPEGQLFLVLLNYNPDGIEHLWAWNPQQSISLVNGEKVTQTSESPWQGFDTLDDVRKLIAGK